MNLFYSLYSPIKFESCYTAGSNFYTDYDMYMDKARRENAINYKAFLGKQENIYNVLYDLQRVAVKEEFAKLKSSPFKYLWRNGLTSFLPCGFKICVRKNLFDKGIKITRDRANKTASDWAKEEAFLAELTLISFRNKEELVFFRGAEKELNFKPVGKGDRFFNYNEIDFLCHKMDLNLQFRKDEN